jgi:molecular chaperone GrpE
MAELSDEQQTQAQEQQGEADANDSSPRIAELEAELAAARAEAEQYKDKFLREYADKENFRKRQERMMADRVRREKLDLLEHLFEVVDNLDRALRFQDTMDRESLQQSLRLLQSQLNELLAREGLTLVPTVGEPFNPYVHEAVEQVSTDAHPEGTVVAELRKGYKLGDETIRPARVRVSAGPES